MPCRVPGAPLLRVKGKGKGQEHGQGQAQGQGRGQEGQEHGHGQEHGGQEQEVGQGLIGQEGEESEAQSGEESSQEVGQEREGQQQEIGQGREEQEQEVGQGRRGQEGEESEAQSGEESSQEVEESEAQSVAYHQLSLLAYPEESSQEVDQGREGQQQEVGLMKIEDILMNPLLPEPTDADMKDDLLRIKNAKTWLLAQDFPEMFSAEDMNLLTDIIQAGVPPLTDYPEYDLLRTMQVDAAAYWIWLQSDCGEANLCHLILKMFADLRGVFLHPRTDRGLFEKQATRMLQAVKKEIGNMEMEQLHKVLAANRND